MDVIGFLYVSLGSNRVQLHERLSSRRGSHVQTLVLVVKMVTCCRSVLPKSIVLFYVFFLWEKRLNAKDINKGCFLFMVGSVRRVHSWVANISLMTKSLKRRFRNSYQSKDLSSAGFDTLVKGWESVSMSVEDMSSNIYIFFHFRISHVLRLVSICDLFTDCASYFEAGRT
jgi:hypothetical protein